ncbi:MAG: glycosyltransferase [Planctomycetaceae bacterium]
MNDRRSWPDEVIVVEPAKTRYSHAIFNASLLDALRFAFPSTPIRFHCHESHLPWVKQSLETSESGLQSISFVVESLPILPAHKWYRLRNEWLRYRSLYRRLGGRRSLLVFASISPSGLFALKLPIPLMHRHRTLLVAHCLQALGQPKTRLRDFPFDLARILRMPLRKNMKLVALGDSILSEARAIVGCEFSCDSVDIPRLRPDRPLVEKRQQPTFAFVGGTAKGFDLFEAISREFHRHPSGPRFLLAGYQNSDLPEDIRQFVIGVSREPIPQEELEQRIQQSHYVIWTAEPEVYRLTASATFADAMCFGVPVIAIRNEFMEHYFKLDGDAGLLCSDGDGMSLRVRQILNDWPACGIVEHSAAAKLLFQRFNPRSTGAGIRGALGEASLG